MKLSETKQALVDLNDGENIENETSFVTAANRALGHISRIVPEERTAYIEAGAPALGMLGTADVRAVHSVSGVSAITFRASGRGKLMADGEQLAAWLSPGVLKDVRVYLNAPEDLALSFKDVQGEVRDLAVWTRDFGSAERIPMYGRHIRYDMRVIAPDYEGFPRTPVDVDTGRQIPRCIIEPPYLLIPCGFVGEAAVTYKRRLRRITLDDVANDADIDIAPEYEDLVPLCMAYYVWLEDEPDKAAFFLARFNEAAALARQTYRRPGSASVISYNGW